MKKKQKILRLFLFAAVLGIVMSFLIHSGLLLKLTTGFETISWYWYLILLIIFFFLTILVHELGHLLSFLFNKIKIRALYALIFVFKKEPNKKWRLEIHPKHFKLLGGLVIPDLPVIDSNKKYEEVRNKFSKALIAGPIVSFCYWALVLVVFLLVWFLSNNYLWIGLLGYKTLILTFLTLVVFLSSKAHTNELYGDFVAYKKFKEGELFVLTQIIQYSNFSLSESESTDEYLYQRIINYYFDKFPKYHLFDYSILAYLIDVFIKSDKPDEIGKKLLNYSVEVLLKGKYSKELVYAIMSYFYKLGNLNEVAKIYLKIKVYPTKDERMIFLFKQYEHMLNIEDHTQYLSENYLIIYDSYELLKPIVNKEDILKMVTFQLPAIKYECLVEFKEGNEG